MTTPISHRRTHHLLLINRLLSLKENASPFTLILDSLSQSSKPLIREYISNATTSKCSIIFIFFETFRLPAGITKSITARRKSLQSLQKEISSSIPPSKNHRTLIIIDSLSPLCSQYPAQISAFLGPLVSPTTSLLAIYHLDVPLTPPSVSSMPECYPYTAPHPLTLLKHLSTTLITVHSINHILLQKKHRDQALLPPRWGLLEESEKGTGEPVEGVIVGMGSNSHAIPAHSTGGGGIVLEMEHRRKSGRTMTEFFFLKTSSSSKNTTLGTGTVGLQLNERVILLEDHPQWKASEVVRESGKGPDLGTSELGMMQTTFDLSLTDRQKKARDEVVLPYFDAQKEDGVGGNSGGGGLILFTPGREDDFDEEEDDI